MKRYKDFINEEIWDIMPQVLANKLKRAKRGKAYAVALKDFLDAWKDYPPEKDKRHLADKIARKYQGVEARPLVQYLNDLVKAGKMPAHLSLEQKDLERENLLIIGEDEDEEV